MEMDARSESGDALIYINESKADAAGLASNLHHFARIR